MSNNRKNRVAAIAPEEFTFGVEIECAVPSDKCRELGLQIGGYHHGSPQGAFIRAGLDGWVIQHDGSLHFRGDYRTMEISSPILQGADGVAQVIKMVELIKSWGGKVNASCGLHVTVGNQKLSEDYVLCQLILAMYRFSDAMVAVGSSFGRRHRNYSMSLIHKYGVEVNRKADGDAAFVRRFMRERYQSLNIQHAKSGAPRVEFRLFAGTLNTNRMLSAIWSAIGICQYAMTVSRLDKAVRTGAEFADATYYRGNVEYLFTKLAWKADRKGRSAFNSKLGVMIPASLPEDSFTKALVQVRKDAKRMDEANAAANFTARVARPARLVTKSRKRNTEGAPSPENGEGE